MLMVAIWLFIPIIWAQLKCPTNLCKCPENVKGKEGSFECKINRTLVNVVYDSYESSEMLSLSIDNKVAVQKEFLKHFASLKWLIVEKVGLKEIQEDALNALHSLEEISLKDNELTDLPRNLFEFNPMISFINLEGNHLKQLPQGLISKSERLEGLSLIRNLIQNLNDKALRNFTALQSLLFSENGIQTLPERMLDSNINLSYLDLSKNNISNIPEFFFEKNQQLWYLNFSHNQVTELKHSFSTGLIKLKTLDLSFNRLKTVTESVFQKFYLLEYLSLKRNQIKNIEYNALRSIGRLQYFDLSFNHLDLNKPFYIPANFLQLLNMSHNLIHSLPSSLWINLIFPMELDLSSNFIDFLNIEDLFLYLSEKVYWKQNIWYRNFILLEKNRIAYVDLEYETILRSINKSESSSSKFQRPISIYLDQNPLHCNCQSKRLKRQLTGNNESVLPFIFIANNLKCHVPPALNGRLIKDISEMDLLCETPTNHCPHQCQCFQSIDGTFIDCSGSNLTEIPSIKYLRNVSRLHMDFTRISKLSGLADSSNWVNLKIMHLKRSFRNANRSLLETQPKPFSKLKNLLYLDLSENNFHKLPDDIFEELRELRHLDLSFNNMTTISSSLLKNSHKLETLNLESNQITSIHDSAFSSLIHLQKLFLSHNLLERIPESIKNVNITLKTLDLQFNKLKFINDSINLPSLDELNLSNNQLESITVEWFIALKHLFLDNNKIKEIQTLGRLPTNLHLLNLTNNEIQILNVSHVINLKDVDIFLTNNRIKNIQVPNNTISNGTVQSTITLWVNLNPLHCDCNLKLYVEEKVKPSDQTRLIFVDDELFCKTPSFSTGLSIDKLKAKHLICESSIIDCPHQCECYSPIPNVNHILDCTQRFNDSLPSHIPFNVTKAYFTNLTTSSLFAFSQSQWQNLTEIQIQFISGSINYFKTDIFQSLPLLFGISINLCSDSFPVDSLAHLRNLNILQITNCRLETLHSGVFTGTTSLKSICLTGNNIIEIPGKLFQHMDSLETLDLSNNYISSLKTDFVINCSKLRVLNLAFNHISFLNPSTFSACPKLNELNFSWNNLSYGNVRDLQLQNTNLKKLNFSHNSIEDVSINWIQIWSLKEIDLRFNKIKKISVELLSKFPCGSIIHLQNNMIHFIGNTKVHNHCYVNTNFDNIIDVNVNYNPLTCDCKIFDFLQLIKNQYSNPIQFDVSGVVCSKPDHLMNKKLIDVNDKDLICLQNDSCPLNCSCYSSFVDAVFNCTGQKLKHLPRIKGFEPSVLILDENNNISIKGIDSLQWKKLQKLSLKNSKCIECSDEHNLLSILQNIPDLLNLRLTGNNISGIATDSFARLKKLRNLDLNNNNIRQLKYTLFQENEQMQSLDLSINYISDIPQSLFLKLRNLQKLSLSQNEINKLPESLFNSQYFLQYLNLSYNQLIILPQNIFKHNLKLEVLDISHNRIHLTNNEIFQIPSSLIHLNLSNNEINFISEQLWETFPSSRKRLENLDFSNNNITELILQQLLIGNNSFCFLNLDGNFIEYFNLSFTNSKIHHEEPWYSWLTLSFKNSPKICDCEIAKFRNQRRLKTEGNFRVSINFIIPENSCAFNVFDTNIDYLTLGSQPICKVFDNCPKSCKCFHFMNTKKTTINCSSAGLDQIPKLEKFSVNNFMESHNDISDITETNIKQWLTISYADFSFNSIHSLPNFTFGKNLEFISLKGNNLERPTGWLYHYVTQSVIPSFQMNLSNNPWLCDCESLSFQTWLLDNENKVKDILNMQCSDGVLLLNANVCFQRTLIILGISLALISIMIIALLILYFRNKNVIHIWLYYHNICICFVKEELIDEDKEFDAFVSYSGEDRDFVFNYLIPRLENEKPYFQLCIHERDWKIGEGIIEQIGHSIEVSRRVIFVVSDNFVKSSWSCFEFKTAHLNSVIDKINRIIIIVLGDLPPKDELDPDLRMHINMNTYLKWGDSNFFNKLRFAMPKKPKRYKSSQNKCFEIDELEQIELFCKD